ISAEKWNFNLFALLYLKKIDEKLHFLPREFRLCPKAELVTLRLVAAYVAIPHIGSRSSTRMRLLLLSQLCPLNLMRRTVQRNHRDVAGSLFLVFTIWGKDLHGFRKGLFSFLADEDSGGGLKALVADLNGHLRMGQHVVVPLGMMHCAP